MGAGQRPAADAGVDRQALRRQRLDFGRALPVPELAHVEVALPPVDADRRAPAEEAVARGLHQPLALDHPPAVVVGSCWPRRRARAPRPRPPWPAGRAGRRRRGRSAGRPRRGCRRCRPRPPCGRGGGSGSRRAAGGGRPAGSSGRSRGSRADLCSTSRLSSSGSSSSSGTSSGGSLTIRSSPSTVWVSLSSARRLSLLRALATPFSTRFDRLGVLGSAAPAAPSRRRAARTRPRGCASRRSSASPRGRRAPRSRTAARRSLRLKPFSRPAISKLAASRLTSHSHGPGSVSSKSLRSKTRRAVGRREGAEVGEVGVAAGLHPQAGDRRGRRGRRPSPRRRRGRR